MKAVVIAGRTTKELLRDPLSLVFMIGLPLVMLFVFSAMNRAAPVVQFGIERIGPGVAMFSVSFIALFSGMLLAGDRQSSFLTRLLASPLTAVDFLAGYTLPLLGVALGQIALCFVAAVALGMPLTANIVLAIAVLIPAAVFFISCGLLMGSLLTTNQVGGVSALLVNVVGFLGGIWLPLALVGGAFETIARLLPFSHFVDAAQGAVAGSGAAVASDLPWILGYAIVFFGLAVWVFRTRVL